MVPRSLRALMLALLLSAAGVAAGGFWTDEFGKAPAAFGMPAFQGIATYEFQAYSHASDGFEPVSPVLPGARYESVGPRWQLDREGIPRLVSGLRATEWGHVTHYAEGFGSEPAVEWLPKMSLTPWSDVAGTVAFGLTFESPDSVRNRTLLDLAGIPVVHETQYAAGTLEILWLNEETHVEACGFATPFHGAAAPVGKRVDLGFCYVAVPEWRGSDPEPGALVEIGPFAMVFEPFTVLGQQDIVGRSALVLQAPIASGVNGSADLRLWLSPDQAAPVQMAVVADGTAIVLRLAGTELAVPPVPGPPPTPAPDVVMAPRAPWGLPDGGSTFHFPASRAWRILHDHAASRAFLERHPNAVAVQATSHYASDLAGDDTTWWFIISDNQASISMNVTLNRRPITYARTSGLTGMDDLMLESAPSVEVGKTGTPAKPAELDMFLVVPTRPSLEEQWQAYSGLTGPAATGEARFDCYGECDEPRWVAGVSSTVVRTQSSVDRHPGQIYTQGTQDVFGYRLANDGDPMLTIVRVDGSSQLWVVEPASSGRPFAEDPPAWTMPSGGAAAAAGLLGFLVAFLYYLWPTIKGGAAGFFSRIQGEAVLKHPQRDRLLTLVQDEPGIHFQELVRRSGRGRSTVQHHLRKLEAAGHVRSRLNQGYTCYVPRESGRAVLTAAPALRSNGARRTMEAIQQRPGANLAAVAAAAGLTRSTAHHHVQRLIAAGLVERSRAGRAVALWPAGQAAA